MRGDRHPPGEEQAHTGSEPPHVGAAEQAGAGVERRHPGGVTAEQCYLDLLGEFGAEVETWRVPVKALPALRNTYRVVQMVELLDDGYCMARLGLGSSSFDRQQMHDFIERIFDRLAEAGVDDAETTEQYRDWRRADGLH